MQFKPVQSKFAGLNAAQQRHAAGVVAGKSFFSFATEAEMNAAFTSVGKFALKH
jgi:hypothetical protein